MLKLFLKRLLTPHSIHNLKGISAPIYFFSIVIGGLVAIASILLWELHPMVMRMLGITLTIWLIINYIHNKEIT